MAISDHRPRRSRLTLAILILLSLSLLTLDARGSDSGLIASARRTALTILSPLEGVADRLASPFSTTWDGITNYGDVSAENDRLRLRVAELEGNQARAVEAERERRELLALLGLDFVGDLPSVTGRVVAGAPGNFTTTAQIDIGSSDGVRENMPAVTGAGLVGKVLRVSPSSAVVLLISDPSFDVGVRLGESGEIGVAKGSGPGQTLDVDFVDARAEVADEAVVTTSGLAGSLFPAGIPVGTVAKSQVAPARDRLVVDVEPLVDLNDLAFVQVLLWETAPG